MSGYFDALMRSSGLAIGGPTPRTALAGPAAVEVDVDRGPVATEPHPVRETSTRQEIPSAVRIAESVESTAPPLAAVAVDRQAQEEPDTSPAFPQNAAGSHSRGAQDQDAESAPTPAARSLVSPASPTPPDLGPTLVRAAMRWVAEGPSPVSDRVQVVRAPEPSLPVAREDMAVITTPRVRRDADEVNAQPSIKPQATTTLPIRSTPATPAPLPPAAPLAREELVEVSIGAIHLRVDAPVAQTVARPAPAPKAGTQRAARTTPARSALSRRALRRV